MKPGFILLLFILLFTNSFSQRKLTVYADKPVASVSPTMWGVFFEDINFGADGGLYAELVKNRSFEFPTPLMGWRENRINYQKGRILVINRSDNSTNSRFARVTINNAEGNYSLSNEGFRGIGVHKGKQYDFSVMARTEMPSDIKIKVQLLNHTGKIVGNTIIENFGKDTKKTGWNKYTVNYITREHNQKGKLKI